METIQDRLLALAKLQNIDSQLDRLRQVRGDLPEEVQDLEDELEGLQVRINRLQEEIDSLENEIGSRNITIKEQQDLIRKYEAQLMEVKNNREYEAVNKEIELANLEILTNERKIRQFTELIEQRQDKIGEVKAEHAQRASDLEEKNRELSLIIAETEKEEKRLLDQSASAAKGIDDRLLKAYKKIRANMRNGLAVVNMDRDACGGCFAIIPPQRRHEIRSRSRIMVCENCGRILVDQSFFETDEERAIRLAAQPLSVS